MPRQARLDAPGTLHHIMGRGIEGTKIFRNKRDRTDFLQRLAEPCQDGGLIVYAWALMSNHFHILARTGSQALSRSMRRLLTGYVINFNRRHKRQGHLFQNRYKSIVCEDDPYLLELTRYIHLNPLRAGVVKNFNALRTYPWTGHSTIMGRLKREWQDTQTVLAYFGPSQKEAVTYYEKFVQQGIALGRRPELVGGGLVRSVGDWFQVLSLRRKNIRLASDYRILGSSEFVQGLLSEVDEREKETLRLSSKIKSLDSLAGSIEKNEGITGLRSASRTRKVSKARKLFCQLAVGKMGYPGAEVARFLGVTTSAVVRASKTEELKELQKYL